MAERHTNTFSTTAARDVLIVRGHEENGPTPLWTAEDAAWATRLARQGVSTSPAAFLAERARHALQRLAPRDATVQRWSAAPRWSPAWCWVAVVVGLLGGLGIDQIGPSQQVNLLAPPVWGLLMWNLGLAAAWLGLRVCKLLTRQPAARWPWAAALQRWLNGAAVAGSQPVQQAATAWAHASAPLQAARAALLLHLAAATLAVGLASGLYLRGLVLDYRAGWQSTFLEAPTVQRWLNTGLAPAR
jgi:hypothetical protein